MREFRQAAAGADAVQLPLSQSCSVTRIPQPAARGVGDAVTIPLPRFHLFVCQLSLEPVMLNGVTKGGHLVLQDKNIPAATEWTLDGGGWMFVRVEHGQGMLLRPSESFLIGAGDVLVHSNSVSCQLRASQLGELRVRYFHVYPELLVDMLSPVERQHLTTVPPPGNVLCWFGADSPVAVQFEALCRLADKQARLQQRCLMLQLAAPILCELIPKPDATPDRVLSAKHRFQQIIQQMPEEELQYRTPAELARMCGCSVRHFSRLFREQFGHSLVPKQVELRLQKAQQLLAETDAKIIDVALQSGYQHVGLFVATFKRHFGLTPSEWRKRQRQTAKSKRNVKHHRLVKSLVLVAGLSAAICMSSFGDIFDRPYDGGVDESGDDKTTKVVEVAPSSVFIN